MGTIHKLTPAFAAADEGRGAPRQRVLIRAAIRVRGSDATHPITVKDISSTGLRASTVVNLFVGAQIEVELPNLGWIGGQVVRSVAGTLGIRFGAIIDPQIMHVHVT